jgi:hypothetical protein
LDFSIEIHFESKEASIEKVVHLFEIFKTIFVFKIFKLRKAFALAVKNLNDSNQFEFEFELNLTCLEL